MAPKELRYTESHEWAKLEGNTVTVGITDHAQDQLGDVVYVELPETGKTVSKGDEIGVIESSKTAAEIYAPVGGTIAEANAELTDNPERVNESPYGQGWIVKIEAADAGEIESLMDAAAYDSYVENLED